MNDQLKSLVILKFGGSCLKDGESFKQTATIIKKYLKKSKLVIVTSAINGITNQLMEFYKKSNDLDIKGDLILDQIYERHSKIISEIVPEISEYYENTMEFLKQIMRELNNLGHVINLLRPSKNLQDLIVSYGEKLSTFLLCTYLNSLGFKSKFISSDEIIQTDDNFGNAFPLLDDTEELVNERIKPLLNSSSCEIACITGYYGSTKDRKITTLGRGGTDLTAALLAYSLRSFYRCKVVYWKDVKGFLDADPKMCEKAVLLRKISYIEAKELAFFGTKVLHPLCLDVSEKGKFPSEIRSFHDPYTDEFTTITQEFTKEVLGIRAITSIYRLSLVTIKSGTMISLPKTASKLFSLLDENNITIKFISQSSSENNITFVIHMEDSMKVSSLLRNSEYFGKQWFSIKIDNSVSLIAVIGAGMMYTPGIAGKIFTTLGDNDVNVRAIAQGSSELNFTAIIERENCKKAINVLYDAFIG
ncbi:MAG: aspartate kinase [Promethearchaeota archaeon]